MLSPISTTRTPAPIGNSVFHRFLGFSVAAAIAREELSARRMSDAEGARGIGGAASPPAGTHPEPCAAAPPLSLSRLWGWRAGPTSAALWEGGVRSFFWGF